jgi:hypothetical protein
VAANGVLYVATDTMLYAIRTPGSLPSSPGTHH